MGKSYVTKLLFQAVSKYLNTRTVLAAPTGKAAYNIQGATIHTALSVPANQSLKVNKQLYSCSLNSSTCKFAGLKIIFIDEVSMVGNSNIQINKRLQDIIIGAIIIAIGDLFQLQPVFDRYGFADLETDYTSLATNLWQKHFKMSELHEIIRKREGRQFAEIIIIGYVRKITLTTMT